MDYTEIVNLVILLIKKMRGIRKFLSLMIICLVAFIFFTRGLWLLDPDFGWHIRLGEYILTNGISQTDPLSYTMPSFPFVDHEWLTNVILAKITPAVGTAGLAAIATIIILLILIIGIDQKWRIFNLIPFLLTAAVILPFSGIRLQIITWFLLSVLLFILDKNTRFRKYAFFLPILFIIWANLHGGFAIGIFTLLIYFLVKFWQMKRVAIFESIIIISCSAATFVNPYGARLWREVFMQLTDTKLRFAIWEWYPAVLLFEPSFWIYVAFSLILFIKFKTSIPLFQKVIYFLFLILAQSSGRHIPLWAIITLFMVNNTLTKFHQDMSKNRITLSRFTKVSKIMLIISLLVYLSQTYFDISQALQFSEKNFYPVSAVKFLQTNHPSGQIFTTYGWAGYLFWKLPNKKDFVDGRMPSWRWHAPNSSESSGAFDDYEGLMRGELPLLPTMHKYGIDTLVLPLTVFPVKTVSEVFMQKVIETNLTEIYRDPVAVIYRLPE